jgi:competence ComEA-like helix-hairpin-helix protein
MWLTPAERRGAIALMTILLLGTCWDLWQASSWAHRSVARFAVADTSARGESNPFHANDLTDSSRAALDLNRATAAELDALPGIGPVLAGRIVARRQRQGPYRRPEDLLEVAGIRQRLFERLRPLVTVGEAASSAGPMQSAQSRHIGRADSTTAADSTFR